MTPIRNLEIPPDNLSFDFFILHVWFFFFYMIEMVSQKRAESAWNRVARTCGPKDIHSEIFLRTMIFFSFHISVVYTSLALRRRDARRFPTKKKFVDPLSHAGGSGGWTTSSARTRVDTPTMELFRTPYTDAIRRDGPRWCKYERIDSPAPGAVLGLKFRTGDFFILHAKYSLTFKQFLFWINKKTFGSGSCPPCPYARTATVRRADRVR